MPDLEPSAARRAPIAAASPSGSLAERITKQKSSRQNTPNDGKTSFNDRLVLARSTGAVIGASTRGLVTVSLTGRSHRAVRQPRCTERTTTGLPRKSVLRGRILSIRKSLHLNGFRLFR
jgi:hypothetical protein